MNFVTRELLYSYPAYQLKQILKGIIKENDEKARIGFVDKLKKDLVINKLVASKFKVDDLPPITKRESGQQNILKKYNTKAYKESDDDYKTMLQEYEDYKESPLIAKQSYMSKKTNKMEYTVLQPHQINFVKKFVLSNFQGAIAFHGVGTGKTLTAVAMSHYYLSLHPKNKVVILSPPALIFNFVDSMYQFGLNIRDPRYRYYTYDKFVRLVQQNKDDVDENTLIIIDEAHNFRTAIIATKNQITKKDGEVINSVNVTKNKKGFWVLEACKKCHKALLLTGTPFINKLYDIENLLSIVEQKDPLNENDFAIMMNNKHSRDDYYKYRISHYMRDENSEFFPRRILHITPIIMNKKQEQIYDDVASKHEFDDDDDDDEKDKGSFTKSFHLGTRKVSDLFDNKLKFCVNIIKKSIGGNIIYTTFIDTSMMQFIKYFRKHNISFGVISGHESKTQKENSRLKYNSGEYKVLLISKAGTEGVDTIGTENIFIIEPQWNESLTEQAIARAIRFKSHYHLPKNRQKVNVYRLICCKESDLELVNKISDSLNGKGKINYIALFEKMKQQNKDVKKLSKQIEKTYEDFDDEKYKGMTKEEKQKHIENLKYNRYQLQNELQSLNNKINSIEPYLLVMSLQKQQIIDTFVQELDKEISQLESYTSPLENLLENNKHLTPKELLKIQREELTKEKNVLFNRLRDENSSLNRLYDKINLKNEKMMKKVNEVKRYQEFYTPPQLVKQLIRVSSKLNSYENLNILEPTAGSGNIVRGILEKRDSNIFIDMVEIQQQARELLKEMVKLAPDMLHLYEQGNFLEFFNNKEYNLIIMNPPFHLQKKLIPTLDKDYYDIDFIQRAYRMLSNNGELIALVRKENRLKKEFDKWLKDRDATFIDLDNVKYQHSKEKGEISNIGKINLSIVILYKQTVKVVNKRVNRVI